MKVLRLLLTVLLLSGVLLTSVGSAGVPEPNPTISLADSDLTITGELPGDWASYGVAPAGDVNGDGYTDILIGAPKAGVREIGGNVFESGEGRAYLVFGKPRDQWPANPLSLANADVTFRGCRQGSMSGRQNFGAGDVNGDGYDDILLSGWQCMGDLSGKTYFFFGRKDWSNDYQMEDANAIFIGEAAKDLSGYYMTAAGDVNGDEFDDFLITAPQNDENGVDSGQVYLFLGGANVNWGKPYPIVNADASFLGEFGCLKDPDLYERGCGDRAGRTASTAGDVNGDGLDDMLIGAIYNDEACEDCGQVYLILGRRAADWGMDYDLKDSDASFLSEEPELLEEDEQELGRRVSSAGDVNGDGLDDFIFGSAKNDDGGTDAGKAYLILGRRAANWGMDFEAANADASFIGYPFDLAARRVGAAGDVNHDGYDDFIIGAPHHMDLSLPKEQQFVGAAYLILGRKNADWGKNINLYHADITYHGKQVIGSAGYDMADLGDFDGDGVDDFLIAAFGGRDKPLPPGDSYLLLGWRTPPRPVFLPALLKNR